MADPTEKPLKLDDDQIVSIITMGIGQSVGFSESKLSRERERTWLFYDGEKPDPIRDGNSSYNSLDVYTSVEELKAQLLDTFSAQARPVEFNPTGPQDEVPAKIRTDYVTSVIFNENPGYQVFSDVIMNGLMERNGIVKAWWEPSKRTEYVELSDVAAEDLKAWLQQNPDHEIEETDVDDKADGAVFKRVRLSFQKDVSQAKIEVLAGEEFGISPMAKSIKTADLVFHRHEMTVSDLIKHGYEPDVVHKLQNNDRLWMAMEPEKIARFMPTDDLIGTKVNENGQEAQRVCLVYESYLMLDIKGTSDAQLYKVVLCGDTILEQKPVNRKPFLSFCPLPRPSAFWGTNYCRQIIHTQLARTYLTRAVVDHAMITTNPKWMVLKGGVANPRELMENRFGGIVNITRPGSVEAFPQNPLNPFVLTTLQMLQQNKQEITSISELSQGLNKDAISKQNSADMVQELITVSQLRQKIIARNFAEGFLRDLYNEVYRLVLENEDRQKIIQVAGSWVPIDFSQWPEDLRMSVSFALGYGEQQKEAMKWAHVQQAISGVPALAGQFTPLQQYYVARKGLEALGVVNVDSVLLPPDKAQPPPPNPMQQAEIAMRNADAKAKEASAQATVLAAQQAVAELQSKERIEMARLQLEHAKLQFEMSNKSNQLAHQVAIDAAEFSLQQQAQAQGKLQANAGGSVS